MQDYELTAYLGPVADDVTAEQRRAILAAADRIEARWPDKRDPVTGEQVDPARDGRCAEAFDAAVQVILGDDTLEAIAAIWRDLHARAAAAQVRMTGALIATRPAVSGEQALADRAGVTRMTVRKALGK